MYVVTGGGGRIVVTPCGVWIPMMLKKILLFEAVSRSGNQCCQGKSMAREETVAGALRMFAKPLISEALMKIDLHRHECSL